jgi:CRISPR-associated endonuclease/helicase Cas3
LLKEEMATTGSVTDRWRRREAWRKLSGRIAMISINVYARPGFHPQRIVDEYHGHGLLREGYYSGERGLLVEGEAMIL